jgi:glucan 1,3-beta-glucosidase
MRLSTIVPTVLATAPALAAAAGSLGFAIGNKMPDGKCKTQADWEADFKAITAANGAKIVRIYSASDCDTAKTILPAAKSQGFKVILGIWCAFLHFPCSPIYPEARSKMGPSSLHH